MRYTVNTLCYPLVTRAFYANFTLRLLFTFLHVFHLALHRASCQHDNLCCKEKENMNSKCLCFLDLASTIVNSELQRNMKHENTEGNCEQT